MPNELKEIINHFERLNMVIFQFDAKYFSPILHTDRAKVISDFRFIIQAEENDMILSAMIADYKEKGLYNTNVTQNDIIENVCRRTGVPVEILFRYNKCRKREYVLTRQLIMMFIKTILDVSLAVAGRVFDKDHATALNAINEMKKLYATQADYRQMMHELAIDFNIKPVEFSVRAFKEQIKILH